MSDKLERFVKQHQDEFDLLEPNAALWHKIDKQIIGKEKVINFSFIWKVAAIIIVFGFSFWAQMQLEKTPEISSINTIKNSDTGITEVVEKEEFADVSKKMEPVMPEFIETEKFYSRKVNSSMNELKVYLVKYPEVAIDLKKDIAELDSVYRALKRDLGDNVAHEEILKAMIQNYRMKLQILEDIKNELQNANSTSTKNDSHEI